MNRYQVGDRIRFRTRFYDLEGAIADPTTIVAQYRNGEGTTTTKTYGVDLEVVKESTGIYRIDVTPDAAGTWHAKMSGTGVVIATDEKSVLVTSHF